MSKKKILLIRLDKIGDLICTLPTDQILDEAVYDVTWVIQKGLNKILDLGEKKRKYIELDKKNIEQSQYKLREFLKNQTFDVAVSFQCPWWVNYEIFKARIPKRIGVLSQWHSFLFLNAGLRQKRSQALQHEFDYNLDLIKKITGPIKIENSRIFFKFKKPHSSEVIHRYNLDSGSYIVVHPGMMGSALNWTQKNYIDYIHEQISLDKRIVITGTDADNLYLLKIRAEFENHPQVCWLQSKLDFEELLQVLYYAEKIIVPSTGVAHIAASLDKEVHAIFSPVRVHHPIRWSPRGHHIYTYLPMQLNANGTPSSPIPCPGIKACLGHQCSYYFCMNTIKI